MLKFFFFLIFNYNLFKWNCKNLFLFWLAFIFVTVWNTKDRNFNKKRVLKATDKIIVKITTTDQTKKYIRNSYIFKKSKSKKEIYSITKDS